MRKCKKCKVVKDEKEYNKSKQTKDGLNYRCKECLYGTRVGTPPIIADEAFIQKYEVGRVPNKSPGLLKLAAADRAYLRELWDVFRENIEPMIPEGEMSYNTKKYRYTPRQVWENTKRYFEFTIEHGQPLTLSGISAFNDLDAIDLFHHNDNIDKEYKFLNTCRQFIILYNELAAQKKLNPAGPIFLLKNMGFKDKFEVEASSTQGALTEVERAEMQKRLTGFSEIHGGTLPKQITG